MQRSPRGNFHGYKVPARAALSKGHSVSAKAFCPGIESGGDEGPLELSMPREAASDCGTADPEGYGGDGRLPANSGMVQADGNRRPRRAHLSAGRFRALDANGRAARYLHGAEMRRFPPMLHHGHAAARQRSGPDYRKSSFIF